MTRATALKKLQSQQLSREANIDLMTKAPIAAAAPGVLAEAGMAARTPRPNAAKNPTTEKKALPPLEAKPTKQKKVKLVKQSVRLTKAEQKALAELKNSCTKAGFKVKKGELMRLGLAMVRQLAPAHLQDMLQTLQTSADGHGKAGSTRGRPM